MSISAYPETTLAAELFLKALEENVVEAFEYKGVKTSSQSWAYFKKATAGNLHTEEAKAKTPMELLRLRFRAIGQEMTRDHKIVGRTSSGEWFVNYDKINSMTDEDHESFAKTYGRFTAAHQPMLDDIAAIGRLEDPEVGKFDKYVEHYKAFHVVQPIEVVGNQNEDTAQAEGTIMRMDDASRRQMVSLSLQLLDTLRDPAQELNLIDVSIDQVEALSSALDKANYLLPDEASPTRKAPIWEQSNRGDDIDHSRIEAAVNSIILTYQDPEVVAESNNVHGKISALDTVMSRATYTEVNLNQNDALKITEENSTLTAEQYESLNKALHVYADVLSHPEFDEFDMRNVGIKKTYIDAAAEITKEVAPILKTLRETAVNGDTFKSPAMGREDAILMAEVLSAGKSVIADPTLKASITDVEKEVADLELTEGDDEINLDHDPLYLPPEDGWKDHDDLIEDDESGRTSSTASEADQISQRAFELRDDKINKYAGDAWRSDDEVFYQLNLNKFTELDRYIHNVTSNGTDHKLEAITLKDLNAETQGLSGAIAPSLSDAQEQATQFEYTPAIPDSYAMSVRRFEEMRSLRPKDFNEHNYEIIRPGKGILAGMKYPESGPAPSKASEFVKKFVEDNLVVDGKPNTKFRSYLKSKVRMKGVVAHSVEEAAAWKDATENFYQRDKREQEDRNVAEEKGEIVYITIPNQDISRVVSKIVAAKAEAEPVRLGVSMDGTVTLSHDAAPYVKIKDPDLEAKLVASKEKAEAAAAKAGAQGKSMTPISLGTMITTDRLIAAHHASSEGRGITIGLKYGSSRGVYAEDKVTVTAQFQNRVTELDRRTASRHQDVTLS